MADDLKFFMPVRKITREQFEAMYPKRETTMPIDPNELEFSEPIRCYDGCFDDASRRVLDKREEVLGHIRLHEPDARVTYFPVEGVWVVHVWGRELSNYCSSCGAAIADAYNKLIGTE